MRLRNILRVDGRNLQLLADLPWLSSILRQGLQVAEVATLGKLFGLEEITRVLARRKIDGKNGTVDHTQNPAHKALKTD